MTHTHRAARLALAAVLLAGVALAAFLLAHAVPRSTGALFAPCRTEDSAACYWNAHTQGNGHGRSFIELGGVHYIVNDR